MTEDIKHLGKKRANYIVSYMKDGMGHFHSVKNCAEFTEGDLVGDDDVFFCPDGIHVVKNSALGWNMFDAWCEGRTENEDCGLYIDIFRLYRIEVNGHSYVLSEEQ